MNLRPLNRRDTLQSLAALGAAGTLRARAEKPLTVGVIYVGPRDDYGYSQAHAQAAAELKKMPGIAVVEEENVPETTAVQKTMTGMILQDGAALLIPSSFGYFDPHILALAPKYQKVRFAHCGGLWTQGIHPANVGSFFGYIDECQYLSGVIAGHMSRSAKIGFIAPNPTPQLLRNINTFTLRAPPPSQAGLAPRAYLSGAEGNWLTAYQPMVDAAQSGKPHPNFLRGGLKEGYVRMSAYGAMVGAAARKNAEATKEIGRA